ncbi:MAG TPA: YitT family protein [Aggregatilineales bacterium]|nr:YitT family protein [Aggregatilineales bacterium]
MSNLSDNSLTAIGWRLFLLTIGALISAVGVVIFMAPFNIAPGGVSGVAVILNYLDNRLPIGLMILLGNIPIQLLGWRYLGGWRSVLRTIIYLVLYAIAIDWLTPLLAGRIEVGDNVLMNSIFGGILQGIGGGWVYLAGGTQGGTSTIQRIIQVKFGIPIATSTVYAELAVILLAGAVFGWEGALYAIVSLFVGGIATDYVMEGPSVIRTATIITDNPDGVSQAIMKDMGRGVTAWEGTGMFTREGHTVLFVTVARHQVSDLQWLVTQQDPNAFLVIGQGHVAYGRGFAPINRET